MHGNEEEFMQLQRMIEPIGKVNNNMAARRDASEQEKSINVEENVDVHYTRESIDRRSRGGVTNLSAEEISHHPLVMKMIEHLEALEGLQKTKVLSIQLGDNQKINEEEVNEEGIDGRQEVSLHD